jgi:Family of unknown function (DUF6364)
MRNTVAVKRNLTIQLDEETINGVRAAAARRGKSVSELVTTYLLQLASEDEQYELAKEYALQLLDNAHDRGDWQWNRDQTYADRLGE